MFLIAETEQTGGWRFEDSIAAGYERGLVRVLFRQWAARLLDAAQVQPGERVVDVACGTGIVARTAAVRVGPGGEVAGVDLNPGMLEVAESVAKGVEPSIRWVHGAADDMPLPDGAFDVVTCQQGLQFFEDKAAALEEMRRVLTPGGRLAVAVWRPIDYSPGFRALTEALERHLGPDIPDGPFVTPDRGELRRLAEGAGFRDVSVRIAVGEARFDSPEELLVVTEEGSPLGELIGKLDAKGREALVRDIAKGVEDHADDEGVVFPMETHVVLGRR